MLPRHIQHHIETCHAGDLPRPDLRANLERVLIPKLGRLRKSMVQDLMASHRSKRPSDTEAVKMALLELKLAIRTGHDRLNEQA